MGRFYIRVFRDGIRERTFGCGSRGTNNQHYKYYLEGLISAATRYQNDPINYSGTKLGKQYRIELVKNQHGEKELYRKIEIELVIPNLNDNMSVHYIVCEDITYITEGYDHRDSSLPPDY